jgi:hypothetical protein
MSSWRRALRVARLALGPVALGFLGLLAWRSRESLATLLKDADGIFLGFSLAAWVAAHFVSPLFVRLVLGRSTGAVGYRLAFRIHAQNLPARYIPGGIWHTVGRVTDLHRAGVTSGRLAAFVFLENSLAASVTLGIGGMAVWYMRPLDGWGGLGFLGVIGGVSGLAISPYLVNRWILRGRDSIRFREYLRCVAAVSFFWIFASVAFVSYLCAFPTMACMRSWLFTAGAYLFSWGVGFLAVFAPQGLGVFEVVLGSLLASPLPLGTVTALVAGFRIVVMVADVLVWFFARLVFPRDN